MYRQYCPTMAIKGENGLYSMDMANLDLTNLETVYLLTLKDFNEYTGESRALNKDEILVYSSEGKRTPGVFFIRCNVKIMLLCMLSSAIIFK